MCYLEKLLQNVHCSNKVRKSHVITVIDTFKNSNSFGIDNISNKIVKIIKNIVALFITTSINNLLMLSSFPDSWKLLKFNLYTEKLSAFFNHRLIIKTVNSKIFDKIIHRQLLFWGPLLFSTYINAYFCPKINIIMYMYYFMVITRTLHHLNQILIIYNWFKINKLSSNLEKATFLVFGMKSYQAYRYSF